VFFVVYTPPWQFHSGGARALHALCHRINMAGGEAYGTTNVTNPNLQTPCISSERIAELVREGRRPVAVYPEIIEGNPLGVDDVTRMILYYPKPDIEKSWSVLDRRYTWLRDYCPSAKKLCLPIVDKRIFYDDYRPRKGVAIYAAKYLRAGHKIDREGTLITPEQLKTPEQMAEIFRSVDYLISYEITTATIEAAFCGCPTLYVLNDTMPEKPKSRLVGGFGTCTHESDLQWARQELPIFMEIYEQFEKDAEVMLDAFLIDHKEQ
jgi:hypothetical protein